jgi:hypothetical protein
MLDRSSIGAILSIAALLTANIAAQAYDETKYPDFKGQWERVGAPRWLARGEKAPLTTEYQKVYQDNLDEMTAGGPGDWPSSYCIPQGMPAMMNLYDPMEIVVTPDVTYILISHINDSYRRIYTDGRDWPAEDEYEPTYAGYSIGRWIDEDGDGKYDVLEVETRHFRGPRAYESTGLPLHEDNQTIIRERIYKDKTDPNALYDDIAVIDHALTRPFFLHKKAVRDPSRRPVWVSDVCPEGNSIVRIGDQSYYTSADGYLMPVLKGQAPPDLRYFKQPPK